MSESKWIIHPKEIAKQCGFPGDAVIGPRFGKQVCVVFTDSKEEEANARLIAAAPDLLEALENIENDDGHIPEKIWAMRNAAIAKAKGE